MGENSCIDRCSSKYWQVTRVVAAGRRRAPPRQRRGGDPFCAEPRMLARGGRRTKWPTTTRPPALQVTGIVGQMLGAQSGQ